jgi:hypothetical protein
MIADGKFAHPCAHCLDHSGAVGQRDAAIGSASFLARHHIVVEIERTGMERDANLPRSRQARIDIGHHFQPVKAAGCPDHEFAHGA